jgi:hypothetical protein
MEQVDLATMTPHKVLQAAFYLQRAWNETLICLQENNYTIISQFELFILGSPAERHVRDLVFYYMVQPILKGCQLV